VESGRRSVLVGLRGVEACVLEGELAPRDVDKRVGGCEPVDVGAVADRDGASPPLAVDDVRLGVGALPGDEAGDLVDLLRGEVERLGHVGDVVGAVAQEELDRRVVEQRSALRAGEVGALP
jgi:hypothetical protein